MSMQHRMAEISDAIRRVYVAYPACTIVGLSRRFGVDEMEVRRILADGITGDRRDLINERRENAPGTRKRGSNVTIEKIVLVTETRTKSEIRKEQRLAKVRELRKNQEAAMRQRNIENRLCGASIRNRMLKIWAARKAAKEVSQAP